MPKRPSRWRPRAASGPLMRTLGLVLLAAAGGCRGETSVRVTNGGEEAALALTVQATGRTYPLPPLAPGASRTVRVVPISESAIYVVDAATMDTLGACCYIEPGYGGLAWFAVAGDTAVVIHRRSGLLRLGP